MPIQFTCPDCAEPFSVGDDLAGRKSRCTCGLIITVPQPAVPIQPQPIDPLQGSLLPTPTASNPLMGSLPHGLPTANPLAGSVSTGIPSVALADKENTGIPFVVKVGAGLSGGGVLGLVFWIAFSFNGDEIATEPTGDVETVTSTDLGTRNVASDAKEPKPVGTDVQPLAPTPVEAEYRSPVTPTDERPTAPKDPREYSVDLTDKTQVSTFIRSIMDLTDAGEFEQAVSRLDWLADKTDMIAAYELRADTFSLWAKEKKGDIKTEYYKKAIADYSVVLERDPEKSYLTYERAMNYGAIADWDNAIKDLATAIEATGTEDRDHLAQMVNMRAYAFAQTGNQQEAERHKEVEDAIRSGALKDASSLLLNSFRRYTAEFGNAWFVLSLEDGGKYSFFPIGLDNRIKIDKFGNVTGPVFKGTYQLNGSSVVLTGGDGGVTKGQLQGVDIKMVQSDTEAGKALVGHVFKYHSPTEFTKLASGQRGGNGNHIKDPQELFHRFILALDGGDMDTVMEFTYLGFGPNETRDTLQRLGTNPVIRRLWKSNGKADPDRALHMLKRMTESRDILLKSNFDVESLRFFILQVPKGQDDDLVANIGDKNGVIFTVYFQDVFMTINGLKMFNVPTLLRKR